MESKVLNNINKISFDARVYSYRVHVMKNGDTS